MNGIRAIAVVLSMVLLLFGASGNTKEETRNAAVSYESVEQEETKERRAMYLLAELGAAYIEEAKQIKEAEQKEMEAKAEFTAQEEGRESPGQKEMQKGAGSEELQLQEGSGPEAQPASSQRVVPLSDEDYTVLLRLVEAEASGQDVKGKMLVANVVINRLNRGGFGSSIKEVIYQRANGKAQFSPVATGKIDRVVVSQGTVEAVERALCGEDESQGALYFVSRAHANPANMAWFDRNLTWLFVYSGHEFFT